MVFARSPDPGRTKTRLIPSLGARGAADLHLRLLRRTLSTARAAALGPVQLWCVPDRDHPVLRGCGMEFGAELHAQRGRTLGERMAHAFTDCFAAAHRALLIGCDCPDLSIPDLQQGSAWLSQGMDAVLGPAEDGGYYLIGLGREAPGLFTDMDWGTAVVLASTRDRLRSLKLQWRELPLHWDVDRPEDLARLDAQADACPITPPS